MSGSYLAARHAAGAGRHSAAAFIPVGASHRSEEQRIARSRFISSLADGDIDEAVKLAAAF